VARNSNRRSIHKDLTIEDIVAAADNAGIRNSWRASDGANGPRIEFGGNCNWARGPRPVDLALGAPPSSTSGALCCVGNVAWLGPAKGVVLPPDYGVEQSVDM